LGLDLHARRRRADAARRQHALAFDLHHADAAIAVRAVAGLGRIAQVRQLDAEPSSGAEDGLAGADVDLALVDDEGARLARGVGSHRRTLSIVVPAEAGTHRATHTGLWDMGPHRMSTIVDMRT